LNIFGLETLTCGTSGLSSFPTVYFSDALGTSKNWTMLAMIMMMMMMMMISITTMTKIIRLDFRQLEAQEPLGMMLCLSIYCILVV